MAASCIASLRHQAPYRGLGTTGLRHCVHVAVSPSGDGLNLISDGKFILLLNFCCGVEKSLPFIPCFHSLNKSSGNSGHWRLLMLQSNPWSWVYISSLSGRPALPSGCPQTSYDASSCSLTIHSFVKMDFSEHLFARARLQLSGAVSDSCLARPLCPLWNSKFGYWRAGPWFTPGSASKAGGQELCQTFVNSDQPLIVPSVARLDGILRMGIIWKFFSTIGKYVTAIIILPGFYRTFMNQGFSIRKWT